MSNVVTKPRMTNRKKMQLILDEVARRGCIHFPNRHYIFTAAWGIENLMDANNRVELYRLKRGEDSDNVHNYLDHPFWIYHRVACDTYPMAWPADLSEISEDVSHALATWSTFDGHEDGNPPTNWRFLDGLLKFARSLNDDVDGQLEYPFSRKGMFWEYKEFRHKMK